MRPASGAISRASNAARNGPNNSPPARMPDPARMTRAGLKRLQTLASSWPKIRPASAKTAVRSGFPARAPASAPLVMQEVEVTFPACGNVEYSLSTEGRTHQWESGQRISVPVGPVVVRARSTSNDCQSREQTFNVRPQEGVQMLRVYMRRVTPESSTASVRDASLSYN